jgi:hypothetical protein
LAPGAPSGVYRTVAELPMASFVPGAAEPFADGALDELCPAGALDAAGVDEAGGGEADEALPLLPQAASPAVTAVASTVPAHFWNLPRFI